MSWSFSDSLSTDRDKVRFKIGDTDTDDQILSNEILDALLTEWSNDVHLTAIAAVRSIIAKFARSLDRSAVGMSGNRSIFTQHYQDLLSDLIKQNRGNSGVRYKGSFDRSRKDTIESDSDFVRPFSGVGRDDFPGTGPSDDDPDWR